MNNQESLLVALEELKTALSQSTSIKDITRAAESFDRQLLQHPSILPEEHLDRLAEELGIIQADYVAGINPTTDINLTICQIDRLIYDLKAFN